jgi:hypothetical protein
MPLEIQRIDTRNPDGQAAIARLRAKLSPGGNVVSDAGRQKTLEVFGTPMAPTEVVERICSDVRTQGLDAVLRYTAQLDNAQLSANTLRVPSEELASAHSRAAPEFLETIRRIRDSIALLAVGARGHLRAGRRRRLSINRADDRRPRPGGWREPSRRRVSAHVQRCVQSRRPGRLS